MKRLLMRFALFALLLTCCVGVTASAVFGSDEFGNGEEETVIAVEDTDVIPVEDEPDGLNRLVAETGADVQMAPQTGTARFIRWSGNNAQRISARLGTSGSALSRADAFLREYGSVFGIRDVTTELVLASTFTDTLATEHLVYNQIYRGISVFAGTIRFHFDGGGALTAVNGIFIPKLALNPNASVTEERAGQIAVGHVSRALALNVETPRNLSVDLSSKGARLLVYRAGLAQGLAGTDHLVYEVEIVSGAAVREFVYVDAHTGVVVDQISGVHEDLSRRVYDGGYGSSFRVWEEEDGPYLGDDKDIQNIIDFSKDTYDLFANMTSGAYRSYDGLDARMETVNNDPSINCPNANWNGTSTNYCTGVTGDDTVAHEWGHAYTEKTQNLIYAWQPGALNESYSDIIGEIVDLINGAGLDDPGGPRTATACSAFQPSFPVWVQVNRPAAIAGTYDAAGAAFGPSLDVAGITGDLVIGQDGDTTGTGGTVTDGCQPLTNPGEIAGKIAVIDRGVCSFVVKAKNAQNAGAIAALIVNHAAGGDNVFNMSGSDGSITIPSVFIGKTAGDAIKAELPGVNVTLTLNPGPVTPDTSYRWLSGEDDPAFKGAIRDMWTPTCFGDPGKVTDTQYFCSTDDGGGVHTNSGVPNHGFALIVDGGDYNGQSIQPLGLTKAAHIYWRTMTTYQHPASGFADHADSLQAACSDLVGQNLLSLTDGQPSGEIISQSDCDQVAKVIAAIELRTPPAQCNFKPLLAGNAPALCAVPGGTATTVFFDDFESKPVAWRVANAGVYREYRSSDWAWVSDLPGARSGSAIFGVDSLEVGNCRPGSDDQSGVKYIESPDITIPADSPIARVAFEHYVATEASYDGGNLWVQVNGGNWQLVTPGNYEFNPYNGPLVTQGGGNTNPLAGLPAFSGSDAGSLTGSWGESQVDLSAYAKRGDTIKLRFALGVDGCNGLDGWYVDDVRVYFCPAEAGPDVHLTFANGASDLTEKLTGVVSGTQTFSVTNGGLAELSWSIGEDSDVAAAQVLPDGWSGELRRAPNPGLAGLNRRPKLAQSKNVVQDGSFEAGSPNPFWAESASTFLSPLCSPAFCGADFAQDGNWYAWFGGWGSLHQSALTQTVTLASSGVAELSFWVLAGGVTGTDNVTVSIDGTSLFVVDGSNANDFGDGYVQVKVDVSTYADGGEHLLALTGSTVGNILLDNVVLRDQPPLCANTKDVPWLSVSPANGSLVKGQSADITVTFDATGLGNGLHEAAVCITTNDKRNPQTTVPVYMSIEPAAAWTQTVFVNGVEYMDTKLINGITPSDVIRIEDRVVVTSTTGITFALRYGWTESLLLTDTKTSQSGSNNPVGTVSPLRPGINEWVVQNGTSNATYTIVRTFAVAPGNQSVGRLSERLTVEGISEQIQPVSFTFQPMLYWFFPIVGK